MAHFLAIEPDVGTEAHALKLDEILAVAHLEQPSSIEIELCSFHCIHLADRDESE